MSCGLTIGQAAAFAGITVKTVRHYHRLGLVAEPARDPSGYRRYAYPDLIRLVQVKTLAAAGVPLADIQDLLNTTPERFAAVVADVQRRLTQRIEELTERRDTLGQLVHGNQVLRSDRARAVLDRMNALGFSADYVVTQWEGLVLFRTLLSEGFDDFPTHLERRLDNPEDVELTRRAWEAASWRPDDPRLPELAAALAAHLLANHPERAMPAALQVRSDAATRYGLINRHREDQWPAFARLNALVEAHVRAAGVDLPRSEPPSRTP